MKYELIILVLAFLGCSKDGSKDLSSADLKGKWIETETRLDTLVFETWETLEIIKLNRGKEIWNGNLLPKPGSGTYNYNLAEDKISLNWMLSSDFKFEDYYFQSIGNELNIGNFYGSTLGETLTFERLD